jgi:DNA-binding CsgD family transcriptional regulator
VAPANLTKREDEIRQLVVDGLTNDAIASELGISSRTVEAHLRMLFRKMGASRRDQLAAPPTAGRPSGGSDVVDVVDVVVRLEGRLEAYEEQITAYDAAVRRLVDRQFPLFDERVEITVVVGSRAGEDVVVERHWTDPNPYLVYRVIRPITAKSPAQTAGSLAMTGEVVGADVGVSVEVLIDRDNRPQALILFQPGLEHPAEWVLRYRTPGLWDPLRARGEDYLSWAAGTLDGRHADGLGEVRVNFVFPSGARDAEVIERRGAGVVERETETHLVYADRTRTGGLYDWQLRMRRGPRPLT